MIGIIHKAIDETVVALGGSELRDRVFAAAGFDPGTEFRIDRNYPDNDVERLVQAISAETGHSRAEIWDAFSTVFLAKAERLFPRFFTMAGSAKAFLTLQPAIHRPLGNGLRGAEERAAVGAKFRVVEDHADTLVVEYRSPNALCSLYMSLARAAGARFGDVPTCAVEQCGRRTDDGVCRLRLSWTDAGGACVDAPAAAAS